VINEIWLIGTNDFNFSFRLITDEVKNAHAVVIQKRIQRLYRENILCSEIIRPHVAQVKHQCQRSMMIYLTAFSRLDA
jgi:hypothetical protein